jgi:hypothetical protein
MGVLAIYPSHFMENVPSNPAPAYRKVMRADTFLNIKAGWNV